MSTATGKRRHLAVARAAVFLAGPVLMHGTHCIAADECDLLKSRVHELIELRQAIRTEAADWQRREAVLQREEAILEAQCERAREQVEIARKACETVRGKLRTRAAEATAGKRKLNVSGEVIGRAEERLKALCSRLPRPLHQRLAPMIDTMTGSTPAPDETDIVARAQTVMTVLSEMQQFDGSMHLSKEMMAPPGGGKREMDVLYVGLGTAFAVSRSNDFAAKGRVHGNGWTWDWNPAWAEAIRGAVAILSKERPASFVALPLTREGEARP